MKCNEISTRSKSSIRPSFFSRSEFLLFSIAISFSIVRSDYGGHSEHRKSDSVICTSVSISRVTYNKTFKNANSKTWVHKLLGSFKRFNSSFRKTTWLHVTHLCGFVEHVERCGLQWACRVLCVGRIDGRRASLLDLQKQEEQEKEKDRLAVV